MSSDCGEPANRTLSVVREEFQQSDAAAYFRRMRNFELTLNVFKSNFLDFENVMKTHLPDDLLDAMSMGSDPARFQRFLADAIRSIHNFLASAKTLIDHATVLYREVFEPGDLMPAYGPRIREEFAYDGLTQFIQGLRNYCLHRSLPLINGEVSMSFGNQGESIRCPVYLHRNELLKFNNWNATARSFIEAAPTNLDLLDTLRRYYDKIISFYKWFTVQRRASHRIIYEYAERIEEECKALLRPLPANAAEQT